MKCYDLHIHSKYSYDSFLSPERILKTAKKKGLSGIAVTDHNTIKGGIVTQKMNADKDFEVIVGSEIKTEYGDIIGIFLNEEIYTKIFAEVIDEIKSQGGYIVLPHPYRGHINLEEIILFIDYIEIFNSRSKKTDNDQALQLAKNSKLPITAGSDAHSFFEIGKAGIFTENFTEKFIVKDVNYWGDTSNFILSHGISLLYEQVKNVTS